MRQWFRYFLGTPERFMRTVVVLILIGIFLEIRASPGVLGQAVNRLVVEIQPIINLGIHTLFLVAIMAFILKAAFRFK